MDKLKSLVLISLVILFSMMVVNYKDTTISGEQLRNIEQFDDEEPIEYIDFISTVNDDYELFCDTPPEKGVLLLSFGLNKDKTTARFTGQEIYGTAMLSCKPLFFEEENIIYAYAKENKKTFYETRTEYSSSLIEENIQVPEGRISDIQNPIILVKLPLTEAITKKIENGFSIELLDESGSKLFEGRIKKARSTSESNTQLAGMATRGGNCVTTYKGGKNSKAMDILIMSQDFQNVQELDDVAQIITGFITTTNPFNKVTSKKDYTKKYNIRYVNTLYETHDLQCKDSSCLCGYYNKYGLYYSLVHDNALASGCPYDEIIVIVDKPSGNCRGSGYGPVWGIATEDYGVSYNSNSEWKYSDNSEVVYHELGHSAFRLADEYVYSPGSEPWTTINCRHSCDKFSNPADCRQGCSDHQHYRPSPGSIMNSGYYWDPEPYNEPSRKRIRKVLRAY